MKCKNVERLMLDFSEEGLDKETIERIKQHVDGCPRCETLKDDLKKIRISLQQMPFQTASEEFFEQTRARCHANLAKPLKSTLKVLRPSIPWWIWAAFAALLVLTGVLMLPLESGVDLSQPLTFPKFEVIILLLQNLVMLFFSPVLFQRIRFPKKNYKNNFMPSGPREA
jgi:hypothetical protein